MQKIIIGNWKMHGEAGLAHALTSSVADAADKQPDARVVLCPPAVFLGQVSTWLVGSTVHLGGQDCHAEAQGAFTGDISAAMLKDAGCGYVIVGHSERRKFHHESNDEVRQKAARAIAIGLVPVICVGESEAERLAGKAEAVVGTQLRECIPAEATVNEAGFANFVLAYEPVWAIGSGKTPTGDDIGQIHAYILSVAGPVPVLYGGSVKQDNAAAIMAIPGVSGVLVGGASIKTDEFCRIIAAAN
jgi:triosephosphate isomerase